MVRWKHSKGELMSETKHTRILLVDDDPDITESVACYLEDDFEIVGKAQNGKEGIDLHRTLSPDIVIMDIDMPVMGGIEATNIILDEDADAYVVVLSGCKDCKSIRAAMVAGAREYLFKPIEREDLLAVIHRLARQQKERRQLLGKTPKVPGAGVWSFSSAVGGVGQTTMILSIANELLSLGKSVIVADMNAVYGDAAFYLKVNPNESSLQAVLEGDNFTDAEELRRALVDHTSGLKLCVLPSDLITAVSLDGKALIEAVSSLTHLADYVLVDLPAGVPEKYVDLLDVSRFIFSVTDDTLGSLKNLGRHVQLLVKSEFPPVKVRPLYVGDSEAEQQLTAFNGILSKLGTEVSQIFPRDEKEADAAIVAGQAMTRYAPKSEYTQAVRDFLVPILEISPEEAGVKKSRSILERLFG